MSSTTDKSGIISADLVIIGAGCSGLALARELSERHWSGSIVLIEKRMNYSNDRTWCFWADQSNPWSQLASHHWYDWRLSASHQTYHHHTDEVAYYHLNSDDYYQACLKQLRSNKNLSLELGQEIYSITQQDDQQFLMKVDKGDYQAPTVIDTRPSLIQSAWLYQCFYGVELKTDWYLKYPPDHILYRLGQALEQLYAEEAKNNIVGLMHDLDVDHEFNATVFQYLLPFQKNHWLIERTWFAPKKLSRNILQQRWQDYICRKISSISNSDQQQVYRALASHWSEIILRDEYGCLPMGIREESNGFQSQTYIKGGIAGNLLRPSTGYGFLAIQQWASQAAQHIMFSNLSRNTFDINKRSLGKRLTEFLDSIFLQVIRQRPELAPTIFSRIMKSTTAVEFSRFMSNQPQLQDWLTVIRSAPKQPFILGLLKVLRIRLTQALSYFIKRIFNRDVMPSSNKKPSSFFYRLNRRSHINNSAPKIPTGDDRL